MTLCSVIIRRAYRETNIIPIGTNPSTAQQTEALDVLNTGLQSVVGNGFFENLQDWPVPAVQRVGDTAANPPLLPGSGRPAIVMNNAFPAKNVRIVWDGSERTVYMPENPADGASMCLVKSAGNGAVTPGLLTLSGNGRTIEGAVNYLSTTATSRQWLYRADLADWVQLKSPMLITDEIPFPDEYDDFWSTSLAIRLSPSYGKTIQAATTSTNSRTLSAMRARYFQPTVEDRNGEELPPGFESYYTGYGRQGGNLI